MKKLFSALAVATTLLACAAAHADVIGYANPGTENPDTYSFTAAYTGDVLAYFAGANAGYTSQLGLLVNGQDTGVRGLNNQTSAYGESINFGNVLAGDSLTFFLDNIAPGDVSTWYSDVSLNDDGVNHVYSTSFSADQFIPDGTYIAFEDLPQGGDFNYRDESFVFTNVAAQDPSNVPEPGSVAILGLGLGLLGLVVRRRQRK